MKLRLLCLTDHTTHNETNSFYRLVAGMANDPRVGEVFVATVGNADNRAFFSTKSTAIYCIKAGQDFEYSATHDGWAVPGAIHELNDFDAIVLRIPRSVEESFFVFLEENFKYPDRIVNRPSGISLVSTKEFLLELTDWCPPVRLVHNPEEVRSWQKEHDPIVLKPLRDYGGRGVVRLSGNIISDGQGDSDFGSWADRQCANGKFPMLAMKYLPRVTEGDKRVIVANGEILGASLRLPGPGKWLCNIAQGGSAQATEVTSREQTMARVFTERLKGLGIVLFGFDTLVGDDGQRMLSEINALSPGGIWPAELQTGKPLTALAARAMVDYLYSRIAKHE